MNETVILIIDDDPIIQKLLEKQLELSGFSTLHAMSGMEALKVLADRHVDLIILDISMPQMDGFQTLARIRKTDAGKAMPVIFLSILDRDHLKIKGLELGADDYMVKPFNGAELTARIKAVLRRKKARRSQQGEVSGDLAVLGITDILQMLSLSQKNATLELPDIQGRLVARCGQIVTARQGGFTGMEALIRLFLLESGTFILNYEQQRPVRPDEEGREIRHLLLKVTMRVDEIKEVMDGLGGRDAILELQAKPTNIPQIEAMRHAFPLPMVSLLTQMEGSIKACMELIERAISRQKITVRPARARAAEPDTTP